MTPKAIVPVIDSMLAEIGGLGFIGLFLSTAVTGGPLGNVIGALSEEFLGDEELLLETFEFLHTFFFEVGISFFVVAGIVVGAVLREVQKLSEISELALDADGDGEVTLDELADGLNVESMIVDLDGDGVIDQYEIAEALRIVAANEKNVFFEELSMTDTERAGECLVIRERMIEQMGLSETFEIENYFAEVFGQELKKNVELSPVTWLPLIPLIAIDNSVDLTRDVVSAASSNAFESCGFFFASPWVLNSTIFLQILSLVWAIFNFWKFASIKRMLLPTLVKGSGGGEAILLPPRYEDEQLRKEFNSSPFIFEWAEQFFTNGGSDASPPTNAHEELFGAVGAKFKKSFGTSFQFHTWLTVALITYSTSQIVLRDGAALFLGAEAGNPDTIMPEIILWSIFTASSIFQLSLAPTTFLNYCFVVGVEKYTKGELIDRLLFDELCVLGNSAAALNGEEEKQLIEN